MKRTRSEVKEDSRRAMRTTVARCGARRQARLARAEAEAQARAERERVLRALNALEPRKENA